MWMIWTGHVAGMGEKRNAFRLLAGKPVGTMPLGRPRRRGMDNIKMDFGDTGWSGVDRVGLAQYRTSGGLS
jgi:hypothetical protein